MPREPIPPGAPLGPREPLPPGAPADPEWPERIEDQLRSLKRLTAVLSVLALAGVGLALWALLDEDEEGRQGASPERVAQIDQRVERLDDKVAQASEETDTSRLTERLKEKADKDDVQAIADDIQELRGALDQALSRRGASAESVDQLEGRIEELSQQVDELREDRR